MAIPPQGIGEPQARKPDTDQAPYNHDLTASLEGPVEVGSGSAFFVTWSGPDNASDYIAIAEPAMPAQQYEQYTYTSRGSPLQLTAPDKPGDYEIRYIDHRSRGILAQRPIAVAAAAATLQYAQAVGSGSAFEVNWSGPGNHSDYIAIALPGTPGGDYHDYSYVQQGSPLKLTAPDEPGNYEIRYVQRQSRTILSGRPITILAVSASIVTATTVKAGSQFEVTWTGPGNRSDYVTVALPGTAGRDFLNYAYVQKGSPLQLTAPDKPGSYEVRYVQRQSATILARQAVRVLD
jgi:Ca-activated chloride channel family protein